MKTGIQIGAQRGKFTRNILSIWRSCEKYILVDTWNNGVVLLDNDGDGLDKTPEENRNDEDFPVAMRNIAQFGAKVEVVKGSIEEASLLVPDDSLDFVYLNTHIGYKIMSKVLILHLQISTYYFSSSIHLLTIS